MAEARSELASRPLTVTELADYLQISPNSAYRLISDIPGAFKAGGQWRLPVDGLVEWQRRGGSRTKQRGVS